MARSIAHRGPDEQGLYIHEGVGFGFRRLAILDLSATGHQPMQTDDGQVVLIFNGEIYNYVELREQLEVQGHRFRSSGDTEVLLRAYCEWGTSCLERLNGMWAFLIFDRRHGTVFGARDRFGIKPLYLYRAENAYVIASEIKSIVASGRYQVSADLDTVARFLTTGLLDDTTRSFFAGIEQIEAGCAFELKLSGEIRHWRYWSIDAAPASAGSNPAKAFADLFEDAVRLHMRSDVPVAVHLSGGLDSASILCASARIRGAIGAQDPLLAFSYVTREFDESRYIAHTIERTGARMTPLESTPVSLWDDLRSMLQYQDEPVHSMTAIVGYQLMRATAASGIRVVLNGQGADETIGGYGNYFRHYWYSLVARGEPFTALREIAAYAAVHAPGKFLELAARHALFCAQVLAGRFDLHRRFAARRRRAEAAADTWLASDLVARANQVVATNVSVDLDSVLRDSVCRTPLPLYLRVEDRNSMAFSVEARVPFLDHRLVSLAFSLSPEWRMRGPWNKFVLREAMRERIPDSVRTRPDKMGFPTPMSSWFKGVLFEPLMDTLGSRRARERGLYDTSAIRSDLERHRRGEADLAGRLFDVVETEIWFQDCVDAKTTGSASNPESEVSPARVAAAG
jgi:asparagine synthase (glutamine-hydrolysing)